MSTARKYGGTARARDQPRDRRPLGRRDDRRVRTGVGSTFTFYHPLVRAPRTDESAVMRALERSGNRPSMRKLAAQVEAVAFGEPTDDRNAIEPHDRVVLIVEDDVTFARILLGLARDRGFKGLMARTGSEGLALARQYVPDAVTLDIGLPDVDGWELLEQLKRARDQRHRYVIGEEQWQRALDSGAFAHLRSRPANAHPCLRQLLGFADTRRNVLVVEDGVTDRQWPTSSGGESWSPRSAGRRSTARARPPPSTA